MFVVDECTLVMGWWLFGWRAPLRPGIPRSRRFAGSRPFRSAKGALVAGGCLVGVAFCW